MKKNYFILEFILLAIIFSSASFKKDHEQNNYSVNYTKGLDEFSSKQQSLLNNISNSDFNSTVEKQKIREQINLVRNSLKHMDFWFRYLEPVSYKKINGPLPVEWETEVFEKFETPYRREGAGYTLASQYLDEDIILKDSVFNLIKSAVEASKAYSADSITVHLKTFDHFYLCNRLFLLNLAAIYTTGFECPETERIIPELRIMLINIYSTYLAFNESFKDKALTETYMSLYKEAITFVNKQSEDYEKFDHYTFIKDFINPLFAHNQNLIQHYKVVSKSYVDYSLSKNATSIFSKSLYKGQNAKGVFVRVNDEKVLAEIDKVGKLLFYDPILSGNNLRSCASCHKPDQYFTDTTTASSLQFDGKNFLPRNSPSLINAGYNHLIMTDGKHISLQDQTKAVITNSLELACDEKDILKKILSCSEYKIALKNLLKCTPQIPEISIEHVTSAITLYYSKFSKHDSPFDKAINENSALAHDAKQGFNVFMGKAQCATCHFAPQFNGVKPPYVGSEFEVLGVPKDTSFKQLSDDKGRYLVFQSKETLNAFRTGTIRNSEKTKPYMHNGVFTSLEQVIDFYDAGGGAGRGLTVTNQTLSSDSLHLSKEEKSNLLAFMKSLTEKVEFEKTPESLPKSKIKNLNNRKVRGEY
ncbi:cytochrome-c peroxidase [Aurantibacillus circumpalustris]|uniref:cytochrome-c peroxidase n=1 Tax=Aurantibacillus circumpalustris TaxID=3036359 RepID=UPI00295A915B|nr:cytochrome c peroxidase [Aurantibacillus circumpalustris]